MLKDWFNRIFQPLAKKDMAKKVSAWYLHSGRSKKSEYVVKLLKVGKAASISEAVSNEKKEGSKWLGISEDGITVKRVGTVVKE